MTAKFRTSIVDSFKRLGMAFIAGIVAISLTPATALATPTDPVPPQGLENVSTSRLSQAIQKLPTADSEINVLTPVGPNGADIPLPKGNAQAKGALMRLSIFGATRETTVSVDGSPALSVQSGAASTTLLVNQNDDKVRVSASSEVNVRVETLHEFFDTGAPGAVIALDAPVKRADTEAALAGDQLSKEAIKIGTLGQGGVPTEAVRALWVSAVITLSESQQVRLDGQWLNLNAGKTVVNTIVTPDEFGFIDVATQRGVGEISLEIRGWVREAGQHHDHANVLGGVVPLPLTTAYGMQIESRKQYSLGDDDIQGLESQLVLVSGKKFTQNALLEADKDNTARATGVVADATNGLLPQILPIGHGDNLVLSQGRGDIVVMPIAGIIGEKNGKSNVELTVDSHKNDTEIDLTRNGEYKFSGTVDSSGVVDRVTVSVDDAVVASASLEYSQAGTRWNYVGSAAEGGKHRFTFTAYDRSGASSSTTLMVNIELPEADSLVTSRDVIELPQPAGNTLKATTDNTITFAKEQRFVIGQVVVSAPTENAPDGLMRVIESADRINGEWVYNTRPAALVEVFDQAKVKNEVNLFDLTDNEIAELDKKAGFKPGDEVPWAITTLTAQPNSQLEPDSTPGTVHPNFYVGTEQSLKALSFKLSCTVDSATPNCKPLSTMDGNNNGVFSPTQTLRLSLQNKITAKAELDIRTKWDWFNTRTWVETFEVSTTLEGSFAIGATLEGEFKHRLDGILSRLLKMDLTTRIPLAGPVYVSIKPDLFLDGSLKLTGDFDHEFKFSHVTGARYTDANGWARINKRRPDRDRFPLETKAGFKITGEVAAGAELKIKLQDLAGITLEAKTGLRLDGEVKAKADFGTVTDNKPLEGTVSFDVFIASAINGVFGIDILGFKWELKVDFAEVELKLFSLKQTWPADTPTTPKPQEDRQTKHIAGETSTPDNNESDIVEFHSGALDNADYCRQFTLPRNDDYHTGSVTLPFPITFFGQDYVAAFVNNNGNISFDRPLSTYTPWALSGRGETAVIAPFFADVDTRNEKSLEVTYGASPDKKRFCVNWHDVGYYESKADKKNSFQLILEKAEGPNRKAGDFNIIFNYDSILWETGSASGGSNGFGGISAQAGYSAGSGQAGTFFQFAGSGIPGALLNGGRHSLAQGSQNSATQQGRYRFEIRNDRDQQLSGSFTGRVIDEDGDPVGSAVVALSGTGGKRWFANAYTNSDGYFTFNALPIGESLVTVNPPSQTQLRSHQEILTFAAGEETTKDFVLGAPKSVPEHVIFLADGDIQTGTPSITSGQKVVTGVRDCRMVSGTAVLTSSKGEIFRKAMTQDGPDTVVTWPDSLAHSGPARLTMSVDCGSGPQQHVVDVYIDPSGKVVDTQGAPIRNAVVTLYRSDSEEGPFVPVPTGSAIMSPSNRLNPMLTDENGRYAWDVVGGYYQVRAEARNCVAPNGAKYAVSKTLPVPPEQLNIDLVLACTPPPITDDTVRVFNGDSVVEVAASSVATAHQLALASSWD